ncbi:PREDICTED: allatostatin-A receptor [Drosophila arizonae]|uniref:Allatostatin-A receptor n=1 Tax=Drosophila arizonae TaxID=7263 RepID=A0ABM1PZD5_DROAR|nr:PREDICTED: allatostatin-A receptor [Drosophila arizonae]XP_017872571.1 PREDICTED: allatostatin-A receptor [Drosophila arizonae]
MGPIRRRLAAALTLTMLISFWPAGSHGAAAIECAEWLSASECNNGTALNKNNNNNDNNNQMGNNSSNYMLGSSALDHLNSSMHPDNLLEMDLERDGEIWPLERVVSIIVPVFFGIIGFAGLLGNALVILVVVVNQQMRSTTNLLIINLAVSDILFVIFCVPFTATDYVLPEWPFGNLWCKFVQYMIVVTCHCSVYTLVLMSFDRFLAVVHPVTSMSLRTERNATLAIMCAWITIVTTAIPVALAHSVRIYQYHGRAGTACVFSTEEEVWSLVGFQVSQAIDCTLCGL